MESVPPRNVRTVSKPASVWHVECLVTQDNDVLLVAHAWDATCKRLKCNRLTMSYKGKLTVVLGGLLFWVAGLCLLSSENAPADSQLRAGYYVPRTTFEFSLDECIELALKQNHSRPASHYARLIAESQHQQALAAYWPQFNLQGSATRLSADPNFVFSGQQFGALASQLLGAQSGSITIPANAFGPGFPPQAGFGTRRWTSSLPTRTVNSPLSVGTMRR